MGITTRPNSYTSGTLIKSSEVNADFNAIYGVVNGNLDNNNISSSAGIAYSKLNLSGSITEADLSSDASISQAYIDWSDAGYITADSISTPAIKIVNPINEISTDGTLSGNSDFAIPTEKAVKTYVDTYGSFPYASGTTYTEGSATTERSTTSTTYTKLKEITPIVRGGTVTVQWDFNATGGSFTSYTKVYVNGVAAGEEKIQVLDDFLTVTDSITVVPGDVIQIYGRNNGAGVKTTKVKNMYIKTTRPTTITEVA